MLLDSFAWIEFFSGTQIGRKVEETLNEKTCYMSLISLAEISEFCSKTGLDLDKSFEKIATLSIILPFNPEVCILSGKVNFQRKKIIKGWGMVDSIILTTALVNNLEILTGDKHFEDLPNVEMI